MSGVGCRDIVTVDLDLCRNESTTVGQVSIAPTSVTVEEGDSVMVKAYVVNPRGNWTLCLPAASFSSSDTAIATFREEFSIYPRLSKVFGVRNGKAYIKATSNGMSDSVLVTVIARN